MIDPEETGACSTRSCNNEGLRAKGAKDIARASAATGVIKASYYCEECLTAAAQRALSPMR